MNKEQESQKYLENGRKKLEIEDYQGAILEFSKHIELYPNDSLGYANRGVAKEHIAPDEAVADYDKAIELDPEQDLLYFYRGNTKSRIEDYQNAIKDYDKAIELNPNEADYYVERGIAKFKDSGNDFHKALELDPEDEEARDWADLIDGIHEEPNFS